MVLNDAGQMVQGAWDELPANYPCIETDAFIVMPNHIHGILTIQPPDAGSPPSPYDAHVVAGCGASVQNINHETIYGCRQTHRLETVSRPIMAAQLLGPHRPQRTGTAPHSCIHHQQPGKMGIRPFIRFPVEIIPYGPGTRVRICRGGLDGMNHLFIAPRAAIIPSGATRRDSYVGAGPRACPPPTGPPSRIGNPPVCLKSQRQHESSASNPRQGGLRLNHLACGEE